jgi:spermidine/putrescine transport system substrate-binding protein
MNSMEEGQTAHGRRFLLLVAAAVAALSLALGLAACGGGDGGGIEGGGGGEEAETVKLEGKPSGSVTISNWPLYIDENTVPDFEKATGVKVKYIEDVNENDGFFAKMQPLLAKGESGGRSMFVVTDWMAAKMRELGYLQNLDKSALPDVEKNLLDSLSHPSFDPDREFSVPWQSGMGGLIVRTDLAPEIKSICDLFDPKYKGKVDFLAEVIETVPLVMSCEGIDPEDASEDEWMKTIDRIKQAVDEGQIRRFTGNDYARDLTSGDAVGVIGWSGDAVQLQADNPNIKFRMPTEGCSLWSDNMVIPVGAPNPTAAEAWMNYVYDPKNQAQIAAEVNYITPVKGVQQVFEKTDPSLAKNPLIFPSDEFTKNCFTQPKLTPEELQNVTRAFNAVVNS